MFLAQKPPWQADISPTKAQIEEMVMSTARQNNISPELFLRIAKCESGLKPDATNPKSTASGLFQFLNSTFFNYAQAYGLPIDDKNDPEIQAELAARMIADGKISAWNESKNCWGYLYE